jgi:ATP-dependent Clp protease ATP-binding subunit ClpC
MTPFAARTPRASDPTPFVVGRRVTVFAWLCRLLAPVPSPPLTWRAQWALRAALRRGEDRGVARPDTNDLLYGLARTDQGVGRAILSHLGVSVEDLIAVGEEPIATSQRPPAISVGHWDSDVEAVLGLAAAEAARAGHRYVGTEHLVLGLLRHVACEASRLLRDRGASLQAAREEMRKIIGERA